MPTPCDSFTALGALTDSLATLKALVSTAEIESFSGEKAKSFCFTIRIEEIERALRVCKHCLNVFQSCASFEEELGRQASEAQKAEQKIETDPEQEPLF